MTRPHPGKFGGEMSQLMVKHFMFGARSKVGYVCACRRNAASRVPPAPEKRLARRTRGASAWALPSVTLLLVPKCPMCIAAYLALGGGLGVSLTTAAHLRAALIWLCWSALALLCVRMARRFAKRGTMTRTTVGIAAAARVALRNARRHIPHLPPRAATFESVASSIPLRATTYGYIKQGHR
jgi:hypothetical protein